MVTEKRGAPGRRTVEYLASRAAERASEKWWNTWLKITRSHGPPGSTSSRPVCPASPSARCPRPADYAHAIVFLASDDAAMITGADLRVDAGALARYWRWDPAVPPA